MLTTLIGANSLFKLLLEQSQKLHLQRRNKQLFRMDKENVRNIEIHLLDEKGVKYTIEVSPDDAARAQNGK